MRLNVFQYHVQDRNYYRAEIISLINEAPSKHLLLSGSEFFYSSGTIAEASASLAKPITIIASFAGSVLWNIGQAVVSGLGISLFTKDTVLEGKIPGAVIINNNYTTNHSLYKITDIPNDKFTGREVTKFMSDYYDYSPHWNNNVYYGNIISKFIAHEYIDAEVSTLGNGAWFPIAVLDTNS